MKKLFYIAVLLIPVLALQSCFKDDKDVFSKPADERMAEKIQEYYKILTSAENGWILEYYPDETRKYGGFIYLVKFNSDGTTEIAWERAMTSPPQESYYQINASNGPLLTFDTYNGYLHYYAEGTSARYQAYKGDYEFMMMSSNSTNTEITLRGKRTTNKMKLIRMDTNITWDQYMADLKQLHRETYFGLFNMSLGGNPIGKASRTGRVLTVNYEPNESVVETTKVAFVFTPTGIDLYEPIKIGGIEVSSFVWDNTREAYISENTGVEIILDGYVLDTHTYYDEFLGSWRLMDLQRGTTNVTIVQDVEGESYWMQSSGLGNLDWFLEYDASQGAMLINCQYFTQKYQGFTVVLGESAYDESINGWSSLGWAEDNGFIISRDSPGGNTYTFVDNGEYRGDTLMYFLPDEGDFVYDNDNKAYIWYLPYLTK